MKRHFLATIILACSSPCFAWSSATPTPPPSVICEAGKTAYRTTFNYGSLDLFTAKNDNSVRRPFRSSDGAGVAEMMTCLSSSLKSSSDWEFLREQIIAENPGLHEITVLSAFPLSD